MGRPSGPADPVPREPPLPGSPSAPPPLVVAPASHPVPPTPPAPAIGASGPFLGDDLAPSEEFRRLLEIDAAAADEVARILREARDRYAPLRAAHARTETHPIQGHPISVVDPFPDGDRFRRDLEGSLSSVVGAARASRIVVASADRFFHFGAFQERSMEIDGRTVRQYIPAGVPAGH